MKKNNKRFWLLLEPEYEKIIVLCQRLTGDKDTADDLFQDSAIKGLKAIDKLHDETAFKTWFYQIVMNTFRSKTRIQFFKKFIPYSDEIDTESLNENPLNHLTAKRQIEKAMNNLSPSEKVIVSLYELDGWSLNELAEIIGKKPGAVKVSLFRARNKMKNYLESVQKNYTGDKTLTNIIEGHNAL